MEPVLVIEAGGTTLRAACFDPDGCGIARRREVAVPPMLTGESVAAHRNRVHDTLVALAGGVFAGPPKVVSVAYPGPVDAAGRVLATPTLQPGGGHTPYDLRADLARHWPGADIQVVNDLTAAGISYAAQGLRDFVILTIGSGIGHKLFLDGVPRVGRGRGGEIGHLRVDHSPTAPVCDCGGVGHLGAVASGRGAVTLWRRELGGQVIPRAPSAVDGDGNALDGHALDGHALATAFHAGAPAARTAVTTAAGYLGHALAALHLDSGVEDFLIIGGLTQGLGEPYRDLIVDAAARECWALGQDWDVMIRFVDPDQNAGLIGAGLIGAGLIGAGQSIATGQSISS